MFVGKKWRSVGTIFARSTDRALAFVDTLEQVRDLENVDVVLSAGHNLSSSLLAEISACMRPSMPGFLIGPSVACLIAKIRTTLKARRTQQYPELPIINCNVSANYEVVYGPSRVDIGRFASAESAREVLTRRSRLIVLSAHSDGVDAKLTDSLAACPLVTPDFNKSRTTIIHGSGRLPRCVETGYCHRRRHSIGEVEHDQTLIGAGAIDATIVFYNACDGIIHENGYVDPWHGFGYQLLANAKVAALVTSLGTILRPEHIGEQLCLLLGSGMSIGKSVTILNEELRRYQSGYQLLIFGDPTLKITGSSRQPEFAPVAPSDDNLKRPQFLGMQSGPSQSVRDYGAEIAERKIDENSQSTEELLHDLIARGHFYDDWLSSFRGYKRTERCICHMCGRLRALRVIFYSELAHQQNRRLTICNVCGVTEDVPAKVGASAKISLEGAEMTLTSQGTGLQIGLLIRSCLSEESVSAIGYQINPDSPAIVRLSTRNLRGQLRVQCFAVGPVGILVYGRHLHSSDLVSDEYVLTAKCGVGDRQFDAFPRC